MCCDCLIKRWLAVSAKQKEVEQHLTKKLTGDPGLSLNEFYVLYFIYQQEDKSMRIYDLEDKVGLTQSAMSRLIARMEQREISVIQRGCCPVDKRGVCIKITDAGIEKLKEHLVYVEEILNEEARYLDSIQL